jgi:hypothetical protein
LRSEDLVRVKSVVKLLAGSDTVVLGTVRVSTIAEIWNISTHTCTISFLAALVDRLSVRSP